MSEENAVSTPAQDQETHSESQETAQEFDWEGWEAPEGHDDRFVPIERFNQIYGKMKHYERQQGNPETGQRQQETQRQQQNVAKKPDADDYDDHDEYIEAITDWKLTELESKREAERQQAEARQKMSDFDRKMAAGSLKHADFEEVVGDPTLPFTEAMALALQEFESPADIAYAVGKDPALAGKIAGMSPLGVMRAFVKIEEQTKAAPAKTKTKAPDPVETIDGGRTDTEPDLEKMSVDEYIAYKNKKEFGG